MQDMVLCQARGANGTIELLTDRVRIHRDGLIGALYTHHQESELYLQQIREIELALRINGWAGYLALHDDAGKEQYEDFSVSFFKGQLAAFQELKEAIELQQKTLKAVSAPQLQHLQISDVSIPL